MTTPAPYTAISTAIKTILDANLPGQVPVPRVEVEPGLEPPDESMVAIFLQSRTAVEDEQFLAAGTTTRFRLRFQVYCWRFAMTMPDAMRLRDSLIADCEVALMLDRTIGGTVEKAWLEGGDMNRQPVPRKLGFLAGGEIIVAADVTARTT